MAADDQITRPSPMYMQVADKLAQAIKAGDYEPGTTLPSETQMIERYGVSRATIRSALAELRSMGLVMTGHGKGTIVRGGRIPAIRVDRSIDRTGDRWQLPELHEIEPPTVTRTRLDGIPAELLGQPDGEAFNVERLLRHGSNGARMAHRTLIPLSVAARADQLAKTPDAPLPEVYQALTDAGHELTWIEHVTARTPYPDERTTLNLADTAPLLVTYRITLGSNGAALLCEELRAPAATCRLTYPITPPAAPTKRPRTKAD
ncbi:GntR family transcriptional regulator [Streptomyces sp. RB6PN25]|uniref:GntR family transcriptional regulator n=1 Tax=Streptomyces humicola TaxID=2953240 RepID=A0ABT1Q0D4_9ACTN|nr:GntR family transcriptional regulator [Streptomyces humicola]MCQ4082237.1 GntR family transcriptional regulator [Streptomyces humicola]